MSFRSLRWFFYSMIGLVTVSPTTCSSCWFFFSSFLVTARHCTSLLWHNDLGPEIRPGDPGRSLQLFSKSAWEAQNWRNKVSDGLGINGFGMVWINLFNTFFVKVPVGETIHTQGTESLVAEHPPESKIHLLTASGKLTAIHYKESV